MKGMIIASGPLLVLYPEDIESACSFFSALSGNKPMPSPNGLTEEYEFSLGGLGVCVRTGGNTPAGRELGQVIVIHVADVDVVETRLSAAGIAFQRYGEDVHGAQSVLAIDARGQRYLIKRRYASSGNASLDHAVRVSVLMPELAKRASMLWVQLLHPSNPVTPEKPVRSVTRALVGCAGRTAYCTSKLIDEHFIQESLTLLRSFVEQLVNALYLRTASDEERDRYYAYTAYRLHTGIGENVVQVFPFLPDKIRQLSIRECTAMLSCDRKGRPLGWSTIGRAARLAHVERNIGRKLEPLRVGLSYFDNSSEAAHGTLYGAALGSGTFKPELSKSGMVHPDVSRMQWSHEICAIVVGATISALPEFIDTDNDRTLEEQLQTIKSEYVPLLAALLNHNDSK